MEGIYVRCKSLPIQLIYRKDKTMLMKQLTGGTVGGSNVKAGTHEDVTSASTIFEVDTGLTSITRFMLLASDGYSGDVAPSIVALDNVNYPNKFTSFKSNNNSAFYGKAWQSYTSTSDSYTPVVTGVSGGKVTIKTATNGSQCLMKKIN